MSPGYGSLLGFAAVVALIPLALWLLKRTPVGGAAAHGVMRVVAMLPLSTNQRILAVEVGAGEARTWLLLGVSPAGIQTLHTMAPLADAGAAPQTAAPFAQLLSRLAPGKAGDAPTPSAPDHDAR
ncbi:MAG: flagellar biosynthetic protein FliO [Burkholderiaceae bacterium]